MMSRPTKIATLALSLLFAALTMAKCWYYFEDHGIGRESYLLFILLPAIFLGTLLLVSLISFTALKQGARTGLVLSLLVVFSSAFIVVPQLQLKSFNEYYLNKALSNIDIAYCAKMPLAGNCAARVAVANIDQETCGKKKQNQPITDVEHYLCLIQLGKKTNDPSVCDRSPEYSDECRMEVAVHTNIFSECAPIKDPVRRERCEITISPKDISECHTRVGINFEKKCIENLK